MRYANYNKLFTKNFRQSLDCHKTDRNLNTLVIGGPGTGKTRGFVWPNLMQANTSFIVLDPKGESYRKTAGYLSRQGYKIKAIDYIRLDPNMSHYNPFVYLAGDLDVQRLATNIYKNTTPAKSASTDPFWDQAGEILLKALMFYLWAWAPAEEQNFSFVLEMIRAGTVPTEEGNEEYVSRLDALFEMLKEEHPEDLSIHYYEHYKGAAGKTRMSIQISLTARIEKYLLPSLAAITKDDDLDLYRFGEEKTVLYCLVPDNDKSFNFIIGMLYTQLFQILYHQADWVHGGSLPVPVQFIMDEFANVHLPDGFLELLATMRSRKISVSMIIQDLTMLKKRYEKEWAALAACCDTVLYLGGGEEETLKWISGKLGKETITVDSNSENRSFTHGSSTHSEQLTGRELMAPNEVAGMPNKDCILFMRGEKPIYDQKLVLTKHPCYKQMERYEALRPMELYRKDSSLGGVSVIKIGDIPEGMPVFDLSKMTFEELQEAIKQMEEENGSIKSVNQ